ncbi:hypothetical protein KP509_37G020900 [Ceratopteris richardii]|uniref:Uncharacterized protein n=2 Tax=Ceratopteris richardii TaxID=49495 RepID=A0A8T2Q679_CERRI|nr:hypothetical protein KP509_37G020900 [Ceratopteris richardii]
MSLVLNAVMQISIEVTSVNMRTPTSLELLNRIHDDLCARVKDQRTSAPKREKEAQVVITSRHSFKSYGGKTGFVLKHTSIRIEPEKEKV